MKRLVVLMALAGVCMLWTMIGHSQPPAAAVNKADPSVPNGDVQRLARLAAMCELGRIHTRELEEREDFRPMWDDLYKQLSAEAQLDASWTAKIIPGRQDRSLALQTLGKEAVEKIEKQEDASLTEFEKRAIKKISQGAEEVLESPSPGSVLYMRPIRLLKSCTLSCHGEPDRKLTAQLSGIERPIKGAKISLQIAVGKQQAEKK